MSRCVGLIGLLFVSCLAGCSEQPKPAAAPPPATPALGKSSETPESPAQTPKTPEATKTESGSNATPPIKTADSKPSNPVPAKAVTKPAGPTQVQLNLNFVTDDIVAAAVVHPKRVWNSPLVAGLKEEGVFGDAEFEQAFGQFAKPTGLPASEIEEIAILVGRNVVSGMARDMGLPVEEEVQNDAEPVQVSGIMAKNNLKQLGLAFHNYHDVFSKFPKAGVPAEATESNKDGLSWRVHLLPYLDQAPLYNEFHLDEPWDSEHNKTLIERMPDIFVVDGIEEPGKTSLHVFTSEGALFAGESAPGIQDITDGTSNTLLCVTAAPDTAEIWTKPGGLELDPEKPLACLGTHKGKDFLVLLADGSVRPLPTDIQAAQFTSLVTRAGGEVVFVDEVKSSSPSSAPFGMEGMTAARAPVFAMTMSSAMNPAEVAAAVLNEPESKSHEGQAYFAADSWAVAFPSEKTVLFGSEKLVQGLLGQANTESTGPVATQLRAADQPFDGLLTVDLKSQQALMQQMAQLNPMIGPLANLQSLKLQGNVSGAAGDTLLSLDGISATPETAQTLAAMVNGLALFQLKGLLAQMQQDPNATDEQKELQDMFRPGLEKLELKTDGNALSMSLLIPEGFDRLAKLLGPELKQAREAAQGTQRRNVMKQIGLAFHNYHDAFNHFPGAGNVDEDPATTKDGLSWRVHLLPYLDQAPLYNQFRFDESWDSEHNKALIELMPAIFKTEGVDEPGMTSVHVFTGPGAPFADHAKPGIREFTDGTSNVLLSVVAGPDKAEIWTKPGGLDFDPEDPFKALGEIGDEFLALFGDGAVRPLPNTLDPVMLRRLIQFSDGEPVEF